MLDDLAVLDLEDVDDGAAAIGGSRFEWTCSTTRSPSAITRLISL
jgi:hypothetical protein